MPEQMLNAATADSRVQGGLSKRSRSPLFSGAIFVVAFAASAGLAWSFFPKGPAPRRR